MAPSKLQEVISRDDVKVLGMDEVGLLRFQEGSEYRCLGTSNLNSCITVLKLLCCLCRYSSCRREASD